MRLPYWTSRTAAFVRKACGYFTDVNERATSVCADALSRLAKRWGVLAAIAALIAVSVGAASGAGILFQATFRATGTGATDRTAMSKLRDQVSVKDFGAVGDGVADDTVAWGLARTALGANGLLVGPGSFKRTDTYADNAALWIKRTDNFAPISGAGILNPYLAPMVRLDLLTQSGGVTGASTGLLVYMPGISGKTITTFTAPVTGSGIAQSVAVADSSVFVVTDVANVDLNQGSAKSENVTITAIADSTHVTGIFTKNHASGAKLFVSGKGDKIGFGCALADVVGNTNYTFCQNLNVQAVSTTTNAVVASEIDVTNGTGAPPGAFAGDSAPVVGGISIVNGGANDATFAVATGTTSGTTRFLNSFVSEAARNNAFVSTSAAGAPTNAFNVNAAVTNGLICGSNQTAATNPNYSLQDPTSCINLTARGTSGSVASNLISMQELIASVAHTMTTQLSSAQYRFSYDGTWQGAAVNSDGSVQSQVDLQVRNASNTRIGGMVRSGATVVTDTDTLTVRAGATVANVVVSNTVGGGTVTLAAGTQTATVVSGCRAICTDTTAAAAVKCAVSGTTLTVTGTGTDVINYFCF